MPMHILCFFMSVTYILLYSPEVVSLTFMTPYYSLLSVVLIYFNIALMETIFITKLYNINVFSLSFTFIKWSQYYIIRLFHMYYTFHVIFNISTYLVKYNNSIPHIHHIFSRRRKRIYYWFLLICFPQLFNKYHFCFCVCSCNSITVTCGLHPLHI